MFTNIVVGTDGSDTAAQAVALAAQLARQNKAKLHVVVGIRAPSPAVVPTGSAGPGDSSASSQLRAAALEMLTGAVEGIEELDIDIHTGSGNPADVIVRVADEVGADIIVVGSKGMRGTRRILGSVPNSVAHKAGCHVLVAKTG